MNHADAMRLSWPVVCIVGWLLLWSPVLLWEVGSWLLEQRRPGLCRRWWRRSAQRWRLADPSEARI
jgi:hypothetical protein